MPQSIAISKLNTNGKRTSSAPQGAGTPIKNNFDNLSDGFTRLVLNLANLIAMQIAYITVAFHSNVVLICDPNHMYKISTGHIPKFTKSHKESSSAPKVLVAFKNLATFPSMASIIAATITQNTAFSHLPSKAIFILFNPIVKAISVRKFGSNFSSDKVLLRCLRVIFIIL